jgi:lipopolysaccharide export LptBFGC system permease protein LptF
MPNSYIKRPANAGTKISTAALLGFSAYCAFQILSFNTDGDVVKTAWTPILVMLIAPFGIGSLIGAWFIWRAGTRERVQSPEVPKS